jgi:hypothetical protein
MTGYEGPDEAPPPGGDPDVPELAADSVKAYCAEYLSYTSPEGRDVHPAAGPDDRCTCGLTITWHHDAWVHLYNDRLLTRVHTAAPATGYYEPGRTEPEQETGGEGYSRGGVFPDDIDVTAVRSLASQFAENRVTVSPDVSQTTSEGGFVYQTPSGEYRTSGDYQFHIQPSRTRRPIRAREPDPNDLVDEEGPF